MGDVVVVLAGAGAADAELLVDPRDVVGVVDGGAATDDGSPLVQLCGVCTAAKTSAEITVTADHQRDQRALAPVRIGLLRGPFLRIVGHARMVRRCDQT